MKRLLVAAALALGSWAAGATTVPLTPAVLDDLPRVTASVPPGLLYGRTLEAEGPPIEVVLRRAFGSAVFASPPGTTVTFTRRDGPPVTLRLDELLGSGAVLALTDHDAAGGGRLWMPVTLGTQTLRSAQIGAYLVFGAPQVGPRPQATWGITSVTLTVPGGAP